MDPDETTHRPELREVERRLRDERPTFTALELDGIKQDIYARAARPARSGPSRRLSFMRSRMAITAILVLGLVLSMSGVGLALTGSSGDGTAAGTQYQDSNTNTQVIVPSSNEAPPPSSPKIVSAAPSTSASAPSTASTVKPVEQVAATQVAATGSTLPFTGYNAIPILVGGIALLGLGLIMRRQTRRQS